MARKTRKQTVTAKDVLILYQDRGLNAVRAAFKKAEISVRTMRRLSELTKDKTLLALVEELAPERGRGHPAPVFGEERVYRAQRLNKGGPLFVRLPVDLLVEKKGQELRAEFNEKGKIVVTAEA